MFLGLWFDTQHVFNKRQFKLKETGHVNEGASGIQSHSKRLCHGKNTGLESQYVGSSPCSAKRIWALVFRCEKNEENSSCIAAQQSTKT